MINYYFYNEQLRKYMLQFCAIFSGLKVQTGLDGCGNTEFLEVPCLIGNKERVVAAILAGHTQNLPYSLPALSVHMRGLSMDDSRRKAYGYVDHRVAMKTGGAFPDDLYVVQRAMPNPFLMQIELTINASNTNQLHQILEQILVLFNPDLQIQTSDAEFDWTKITTVKMTEITNEENYPSGQDRRIMQWTLGFEMPIFLSIPMGIRDEVVKKVVIQIGDMSTMTINEVDENGNLLPFGTPIAQVTLTEPNNQGLPVTPAKPI
jgi:hypothetical protein